MSGDLERSYRRVLRLLPRYYRERWEEDMVAAFLDSWLTGSPQTDAYIRRVARPSWAEMASVAGLAARLYLGGAGTPRRYFAWGQAVRRGVLAVLLIHAMRGVAGFVLLACSRHVAGWLPTLPAGMVVASPGAGWPTVTYLVGAAWIVIFVTLVLGQYRMARVLAALAVVPDLVFVLQHQLAGQLPAPFGIWAFWVLLDLLPVLAMAAFHADAPPPAGRPWLLALPASYLLVGVPVLALQVTGNVAWLPDFSGLCCLLAAVACLAHAASARLRRPGGSGAWSLTLTLLAAVAGVFRIVSMCDYLQDPHLINVSLAELLILAVAAALVAPDAAHTQAALAS